MDRSLWYTLVINIQFWNNLIGNCESEKEWERVGESGREWERVGESVRKPLRTAKEPALVYQNIDILTQIKNLLHP